MAGTNKVIALFDVDGTLTVPRKVRYTSHGEAKAGTCSCARRIFCPPSAVTALLRCPGARRARRRPRADVATHDQAADPEMLTFLQELRKARFCGLVQLPASAAH